MELGFIISNVLLTKLFYINYEALSWMLQLLACITVNPQVINYYINFNIDMSIHRHNLSELITMSSKIWISISRFEKSMMRNDIDVTIWQKSEALWHLTIWLIFVQTCYSVIPEYEYVTQGMTSNIPRCNLYLTAKSSLSAKYSVL